MLLEDEGARNVGLWTLEAASFAGITQVTLGDRENKLPLPNVTRDLLEVAQVLKCKRNFV